MELSPHQQLHGFTVQSSEPLREIDGTASVLFHEKSGAKLLYLANDDENKAFSIAFKTPPTDDTGVFHILEHSVLCGSAKFPVKEPFVNLLKSSMQTFLNAMTFPDKTMYPVASTNDQDLMNLTDVYLDAVLRPAIYRKRAIFEQEGWHYELAGAIAGEADDDRVEIENEEDVAPSENGKLTFNGVVYNEMKGALSDPNSVLYDELQAALFPDNAYRFESGGVPRAITDLTYEQFLDEHAAHYRLDNSYLTLYGNVDLDRMLAFLDSEYLTPLAADAPEAGDPFPIEEQKPVVNAGIVKTMDTAPENACVGLGYVAGHVRDRTRMVAADILIDALMGSNEAPLKRALLDEQLGDDIQSFFADSLLQPFVVVELKGSTEQTAARFKPAFDEALRTILDEGIDPALIEASLSRAEFVMREHDFGMADGVALAMASLSGWLYDDELASSYLCYEDDFAFLREAIDTAYFADLARSLFLDNDHWAEVEIRPVETDGDNAEQDRLALVESTMGADDFARIAAEEQELRRLQTEPDAPEALATLPRLSTADIAEQKPEVACELLENTPLPCLRHDIPSHGITYAYRYFDLSRLAFDELPYAAVLGMVLGKLATSTHTASELDTLVNGRLGNLSFFAEIYENEADSTALLPKFVASASALDENIDDLRALPLEIMRETDFSDTGKIKDILQQRRIHMEQGFASAGHSAAMARVSSYYLPAGAVREQLGGVGFYRFLKDLLAHFDERADDLKAQLERLARLLFVDEGSLVSFTGSDASFERFWQQGALLESGEGAPSRLIVPQPHIANEAFIVPSDVCYAAQGFDRRITGTPYTGSWQVAARALSYDYLWNEVRVKGGAYGAGFQAARTGTLRFYSYRDPHLDETLARFDEAAAWLARFEPEEAEMEGYVVSTVAGFDTPLKPRARARRQDGDHFGGRTPAARTQTRREMVETGAADMRALAPTLEDVLARKARCAFGSKDILMASQAEFDVIDLLNE